jgi:hypothetical protein
MANENNQASSTEKSQPSDQKPEKSAPAQADKSEPVRK